MTTLDVPVCGCVAAARRLSTIFPIPSRYRTEGGGVGVGCSPIYGYLVVNCAYCGTALRSAEGLDLADLVALREGMP
jgi:hypothetical protein